MSLEVKPEWLLEMAAKEDQHESIQVGNIRDALLKLKAQEEAKRDAELNKLKEEYEALRARLAAAEEISAWLVKNRGELTLSWLYDNGPNMPPTGWGATASSSASNYGAQGDTPQAAIEELAKRIAAFRAKEAPHAG